MRLRPLYPRVCPGAGIEARGGPDDESWGSHSEHVRGWRFALGVVVLVATVGPGSSVASALQFARCGQPSHGVECARLVVPLDNAGRVPGSVSLSVVRRSAVAQPARGVMVALAGGPGQAATSFTDEFAASLHAGLVQRDLVVFDQRGTGASGFLECASLRALDGARALLPGALARAVGRCAMDLGSASSLYTTRDSVEDLESLRQALGVPRIALYGVSYGTRVALAYAWRYPEHVELMVLDSVVPLSGFDPLGLRDYAAARRVLRDICAVGCGAITRDPVRDLARLVNRWERRPPRVIVPLSGGQRAKTTLTAAVLAGLLGAASDNPILRAELPADVRAALNGDLAPIVRAVGRVSSNPRSVGRGFSQALNLATVCEEANWPWQRGVSPARRYAQARRTIAATSLSTFSPFDRQTVLAGVRTEPCLFWPQSPQAPTVLGGPFPRVPTLLLAGVDDLTTPLEDARLVARQLPGSILLEVPDTGHSVLGTDLSGCAQRQLDRFFTGTPVQRCPQTRLFAPAPVPPTSLSQIHLLPPGIPGKRGQTMTAALLTIEDTERAALEAGLNGSATVRGQGLLGGTFRATRTALTLDRIMYIPGVAVSGRATSRGITLAIGGRAAAHGRLTITNNGLIFGRLDGHYVAARLRTAATAADTAASPQPSPRGAAVSTGWYPLSWSRVPAATDQCAADTIGPMKRC